MSQTKQEFIRDFCPICSIKVTKDAINCNNCGSSDLIPDPYSDTYVNGINEIFGDGIISGEYEPTKFPVGVDNKEEFGLGINSRDPSIIKPIAWRDKPTFVVGQEKEESKLELDENAVHSLTTRKFGFLTGLAGTGKTTLINEINRLHPNLFEICATTGIAAVNCNSKTVHSTLKFYDTKSLENAWREQLLHMNLRLVRSRRSNLLIDEASMLGAEQLDLIMNAVDDINQDDTGKELGLWLSGDLCQLPPVKMKYVFKSDYWDRFANNTVKLTKVWRQDNLEFMKGINLVRANKGQEAMKVFKECGVNFIDKVNDNFEGTTLIPNNNDVDSYNEKRLRDISGALIRSQSKIRGKELREWEKLVPAELRLKVGAYVMILSNDTPEFTFVNGDCGLIEDYNEDGDYFVVKLKRNSKLVNIKRIKRQNFSDKEPDKNLFTKSFTPYQDFKTGDWVIGEISYHPLRLAYASTIHKSQGLSLDMVQINTNPPFFGYDSMGYVSISRARNPEGLFLVGKPEFIGRKITMNKEVMKYV